MTCPACSTPLHPASNYCHHCGRPLHGQRPYIAPMTELVQIDESLSRREEVWLRAWCSLAGSIGCTNYQTARKWADGCLIDFDATFPGQTAPGVKPVTSSKRSSP